MTSAPPKKPVREDWHPAEVIAELRKIGITLTGLAKAHGLTSNSTMSKALTNSYPLNEKRIADALGLHPMAIWPSRYNEDGSAKPRGFRETQFNAIENVRNSKRHAASGSFKEVA